MTNEQKQIIGEAAILGLGFSTSMGATTLNVCDLLNERTCGDATLQALSEQTEAAIAKSKGKKNLFQKKTTDTSILEKKLVLLETIAELRIESRAAAEIARKEKKNAESKLAVLMMAKDKKDIEAIEAMSAEQIDAAIAEAEAKLK